jgi:hypothetical protein
VFNSAEKGTTGQRVNLGWKEKSMFLLQILPPAVAIFLKSGAGASMYEYALVASLFAVVGVIVLIALA